MAAERIEIARIKKDWAVNTVGQALVVIAARKCRRVVTADCDESTGEIVFYATVPLPKSIVAVSGEPRSDG